MALQSIPFHKFRVCPHDLWNNRWLALAAGDFAGKDFNAMTVAWGSLGTMWSKPFVQIVVRPGRHTYGFTERYDTFTLCAFPQKYTKALQIIGSKSGRQGNKLAEAGLTPCAASVVAAPAFTEAELILECRKVYRDSVRPDGFLDPAIEQNYPAKNYHRIYFGEIVAIQGTADYTAP